MEDPKKPKQLTEESPLVEFSATGNIYVDPSYTAEGTPMCMLDWEITDEYTFFLYFLVYF